MTTGNGKPRRPSTRRAAVPAPEESLGIQVIAAVGYAVVIVALVAAACTSFTDDFGLGQAELACPPVALACLAGIRRHARR